ncbi:MAG: ribosomal protein [Planctomycetota bacterium]|jgi:small subunit ribosomal protein S17
MSSESQAPDRAERKSMRGKVTSNKMNKTIVVEVPRKVRHPLYEKYLSRSTKLYVHDEKNEARVGDVVEVMQTRPLSRLKRWRLVSIVQKAPQE